MPRKVLLRCGFLRNNIYEYGVVKFGVDATLIFFKSNLSEATLRSIFAKLIWSEASLRSFSALLNLN